MNAVKYTVLSCALMAVVGCSNEPKTTQTPEVAKPEVQPLMLNCDDASIKNRLVREVQSALDERAALLIKDYEDADEVGLSRRLQQRLAELALDLQNVKAVEGKVDACQTDLQVLFTADDIKYANAHAKNTRTAEVTDLLAEHKLGLAADNSLTLPLHYLVSGMDVNIKDTPDAFDVIAQILVASAYGSATNDEVVNIAGRTAPTIVPVAPIAPVVIPRPELAERQNDEGKTQSPSDNKAEQTSDNNKAVQVEVTRTIKKAETSDNSDSSSNDSSNTKSETSESKADTKTDNKVEAVSEKAEPTTSSEAKAETKTEPKSEAKPDDTGETD